MTENNEFARRDLAVDRDIEVDCDIGQEITAYIETWFDVDQKFGTNIADEDGTWLNMYGKYNPFGRYALHRMRDQPRQWERIF